MPEAPMSVTNASGNLATGNTVGNTSNNASGGAVASALNKDIRHYG